MSHLYPLSFVEIASSIGSIAILNNNGDNGSPCLTPRVIGISLVSPVSSLKWVFASLYRSPTSSTKSGEMPNLCRALSISIWLTVSNAVARFKVEDTEPVSVLLSVTDHVLKYELVLWASGCRYESLLPGVQWFLASIFVYRRRRTLNIFSGLPLLTLSSPSDPLGSKIYLFAFMVSGTFFVTSHILKTLVILPLLLSRTLRASSVTPSEPGADSFLAFLMVFWTSSWVIGFRKHHWSLFGMVLGIGWDQPLVILLQIFRNKPLCSASSTPTMPNLDGSRRVSGSLMVVAFKAGICAIGSLGRVSCHFNLRYLLLSEICFSAFPAKLLAISTFMKPPSPSYLCSSVSSSATSSSNQTTVGSKNILR